MERKGLPCRPELASWVKVNRRVSVAEQMPDFVRRNSLNGSFLVRPEMPMSIENRAQFAIPASERWS